MAEEMDAMRGQVMSITQKWQGQSQHLHSDMIGDNQRGSS